MLIKTSRNAKTLMRECLERLRNFKYERTPEGLYFPHERVIARGMYTHNVNGLDERTDHNLLVDQGLTHMLEVEFGAGTRITAWYLALYAGSTAPAANWTAANFSSTASEITSGSEGYSESTRQAFTPATATADAITNVASKAAFTIVTASQLNVKGAGLLSSNVKGGTSGVLASATAFASTRVLNNTDVFNLGYTVTFSST